MRRHGLTWPGDWVKIRLMVKNELGLPPSLLLRQVFERAENYGEARDMLMKTTLAMPAIFVLTGTKPGQGCIIERLE